MKHLKLFEQFEDEEPWWDKESEFDVVKDLRIGKNGNNYFVLEEFDKNYYTLFNHGSKNVHHKGIFKLNLDIKDGEIINVYSPSGERIIYKYKDLPKEIKDRLIR